MKLAIVDLDGTLFDERHRNHLAKEGNWDNYHQAHKHDGRWPLIEEFVRELSKDHEILFMTGRNEKYRASTARQLGELGIQSLDLIMRPDDDFRESSTFKAEALSIFLAEDGQIDQITMIDDCRKNLYSMMLVCESHGIKAQAWLAKDGRHTFDSEYGPCAKVRVSGNVFAPKAPTAEKPMCHLTTGQILRSMADTFEERNKVYGSNYERVAPIMKILFPDGLTPEILHSDQWHLFELIVVKLTRFAISGLQHKDSIHDTGVYAAMIESILEKQNG